MSHLFDNFDEIWTILYILEIYKMTIIANYMMSQSFNGIYKIIEMQRHIIFPIKFAVEFSLQLDKVIPKCMWNNNLE